MDNNYLYENHLSFMFIGTIKYHFFFSNNNHDQGHNEACVQYIIANVLPVRHIRMCLLFSMEEHAF